MVCSFVYVDHIMFT